MALVVSTPTQIRTLPINHHSWQCWVAYNFSGDGSGGDVTVELNFSNGTLPHQDQYYAITHLGFHTSDDRYNSKHYIYNALTATKADRPVFSLNGNFSHIFDVSPFYFIMEGISNYQGWHGTYTTLDNFKLRNPINLGIPKHGSTSKLGIFYSTNTNGVTYKAVFGICISTKPFEFY